MPAKHEPPELLLELPPEPPPELLPENELLPLLELLPELEVVPDAQLSVGVLQRFI